MKGAVHPGMTRLFRLPPPDVRTGLVPAIHALAAPTPLAFWRKKRGMTQASLGEAVGISQSYVASLETGDRKGDPSLFKRLADALKVKMEDIVAD